MAKAKKTTKAKASPKAAAKRKLAKVQAKGVKGRAR